MTDELVAAPTQVAAPPRATAELARTAAWLSKQVDVALATENLTTPQYRVLCFLDEGSAESAAVARRLAVRPATVTSVMDGLVSKGYVERHHAEDDRRRVRHVLTSTGRVALAQADQAVVDRLDQIASSLPEEDQSEEAFAGLSLWRQALMAYRLRKVEA